MDQRHSKLYTEEAASEGIRLSQLQFSARNKLQQADFDREFRSVLCLELVRIAAAAAAWHHQRSHSPEAVHIELRKGDKRTFTNFQVK